MKSGRRSASKAKKVKSVRPRNPFALVLRKRAAGAEPSTRAYKRRAKHEKKIEVEE